MDPTTPENLERFIHAQQDSGFLYLVPSYASPDWDGLQTPTMETSLSIAIHQVLIRNAWEIGPIDLDSVAIDETDDPIIPEGIPDPPVLKLLQARRTDRQARK